MTRKTYRLDEVSELLGISYDSVYRAVRRGDIQAFKLGKHWLVPAEALSTLCSQEPASA